MAEEQTTDQTQAAGEAQPAEPSDFAELLQDVKRVQTEDNPGAENRLKTQFVPWPSMFSRMSIWSPPTRCALSRPSKLQLIKS